MKYRVKRICGAYHVIQRKWFGFLWLDTEHSSFYKPKLDALVKRLNNERSK